MQSAMNDQACSCDCGCGTQPCGCCTGVEPLTPVSVHNRPGLPALIYRVGTHSSFFASMQARLSTMVVDGVGADGQTPATFRPLEGLTTRARDDFSIALLDGWAAAAHVLTFYQERIANEGFLRTATERRSVLELANLVGYRLRPGVAATVFLAYTPDDNQLDPVTIETGARSQSIPGPGESPQSFETSEPVVARREWNNLQVRLSEPANITNENALEIDTIHIAGTAANLRKGDKLLLVFDDEGDESVMRTVTSADTQFADQRTAVRLEPIPTFLLASLALLRKCIEDLTKAIEDEDENEASITRSILEEGQALFTSTLLGAPTEPHGWRSDT